MAVATIEADEAVASSVFVLIMGTSLKKLLVKVILVIFGNFASSDFNVWLRWWSLNVIFCKSLWDWWELPQTMSPQKHATLNFSTFNNWCYKLPLKGENTVYRTPQQMRCYIQYSNLLYYQTVTLKPPYLHNYCQPWFKVVIVHFDAGFCRGIFTGFHTSSAQPDDCMCLDTRDTQSLNPGAD